MSMLFWCLILNDDKIEQLSAVVPSHKPNFDTFKQSNLSFFCGSSGSKLASLASSLCFRWWPCWELLHDFMDASYFKRVMILWNSLRKQFCHFQCPNADFVWSFLKKLIALIAHHPFSTTSSNMFQLPPQGDKKQHTWPTLPSQHRIPKLHPAKNHYVPSLHSCFKEGTWLYKQHKRHMYAVVLSEHCSVYTSIKWKSLIESPQLPGATAKEGNEPSILAQVWVDSLSDQVPIWSIT